MDCPQTEELLGYLKYQKIFWQIFLDVHNIVDVAQGCNWDGRQAREEMKKGEGSVD